MRSERKRTRCPTLYPTFPASDIQRLQHTINQTRRWALTTQLLFPNGRLDNTEEYRAHSDAAAIH